MGLGDLFGKMFGSNSGAGKGAESAAPVEYNGYTIVAQPLKEGGQFKSAGMISKQIDGEMKSAQFIRADNHSDRDSAVSHSERKAKQIIDEQGDAMFERDHI